MKTECDGELLPGYTDRATGFEKAIGGERRGTTTRRHNAAGSSAASAPGPVSGPVEAHANAVGPWPQDPAGGVAGPCGVAGVSLATQDCDERKV